MATHPKAKELINALLDGGVLQMRAEHAGREYWTEGGLGFSGGMSDQIMRLLNWNPDTAPNLYRIKPAGQHVYHLVLKHEDTGRKQLHVGRHTLTEAVDDGSKTYPFMLPVYILHIEFDPEDDSIRKQEMLGLEGAGA
jgi:hypothetical protein